MPGKSLLSGFIASIRVNMHLGELKLLQLEFLHHIVTDDIGRCEQPAPTTTLLVRDGVRLEVYLVIEDMGVCNLG